MILTRLMVVLAILSQDSSLSCIDSQCAEVHRVGTHIRDMSRLVERLREAHGLRNREMQFAHRLLLERRSGERRCRRAMTRFVCHRGKGVGSRLAAFQEFERLLLSRKTMVEFGFESYAFAIQSHTHKLRHQAIGSHWYELLYLAFALHNKTYRYRLHAPCAQARDDLFPQHWRELEAHNAIHHAASLLRVHQVVVNIAGMIDRLQNGLLGGVVEGDTAYLLLRQLEYLLDMPCDGLSLAVGIARQPHLVGLERLFAQRSHQLLLVLIYHIIRRIAIGKVNAHAISAYAFNITDMPLR